MSNPSDNGEKTSHGVKASARRRALLIAVGLLIFTTAAGLYHQTVDYPFISLDDHLYTANNPHVRQGLSIETVKWAFTDAYRYSNYWIPLTWLSFLIDGTVHGASAAGAHLTNLLLHAVNSLLLFAWLYRASRQVWPSALAALFFAVHPLHVESVAWVTERKDVLSMCFWLLTLLAYTRYTQKPSTTGYCAVVFLFSCGLMAKPMVVTLPFVLLLLDIWPLQRISPREGVYVASSRGRKENRRRLFALIGEKAPLLGITAAAIVAAVITQDKGGAIVSSSIVPVETRFLAVPVFYVSYLFKAVWPATLALVYPYPTHVPLVHAAGASIFLLVVTAAVVWARRRAPYVLVGWIWYLGTMLPVIGLEAIGPQGMTDRYTHIPLVGIYVAVAWGSSALASGSKRRTVAVVAAALIAVFVLAARTVRQVSLWRSPGVLYEHTLSVTENNWFVHNLLGLHYDKEGRPHEAVEQFSASLLIADNNPAVHVNLAQVLVELGEEKRAAAHFKQALELDPALAGAHNGLGNLRFQQGHIADALSHYERAIDLRPGYAIAHYNLGRALVRVGKSEAALEHYLEAIRLDPYLMEAYNNIGVVMVRLGRREVAIELFKEALRVEPGSEMIRRNLAALLDGPDGSEDGSLEDEDGRKSREPGTTKKRIQLEPAAEPGSKP